MAYVLHRTNANLEYMPTYQRLIKKERLTSIREFIKNNGYFPNSLIVTVDKESLLFDVLGDNTNYKSIPGILHLPKEYHSLYVIDGQHRLYGYTGSPQSETETIPVVAFTNLSKTEQVKMFMDINENQKVVSKALRNTLNIDLLWNSTKKTESNLSLMLYIAHKLGEEKSSPLCGRIVTGENTTTIRRCITIECIKDALDKTRFISKYKKNNDLISQGTLDLVDNQSTADLIIAVLKKFFDYISSECEDEWNKGSLGYLTINNTTFAMVKIFDDIINLILNKEGKTFAYQGHDPKVTANALFEKCKCYLDVLAYTLCDLKEEKANIIKNAKGGSANKLAWNTIQVEMNSNDPSFINDELQKYISEKVEDYREEVLLALSVIDDKILSKLKTELENRPDWVNTLLPEGLKNDVISKFAVEDNRRKNSGNNEPVKYSDFLDYGNLKFFVNHQTNWSTILAPLLKNNYNTNITKNAFLQILPTVFEAKNRIKDTKKHISKTYLESMNAILLQLNLVQGE